MTAVCEHVASANPRHTRDDGSCVCVRCAKPFTPPSFDRDPEFEHRMLKEASQSLGLGHVADALHAFADRRALAGPVRTGDRDLIREAEEECGDLVSYVTWELQRMLAEGVEDHERSSALWEVLQHQVLTYAALQRAR